MELKIENFKGVRSLALDFKSNICKIVGENGAGKTTALHAIHWLYTGRHIDGSNKPVIPFYYHDGNPKVSLKYNDKLIFERECAETRELNPLTKEGYTIAKTATVCRINGEEIKERSFQEELAKAIEQKNATAFGIDLFKLAMNPFFLGDMGERTDWKSLRSFFVSVIGEPSYADVADCLSPSIRSYLPSESDCVMKLDDCLKAAKQEEKKAKEEADMLATANIKAQREKVCPICGKALEEAEAEQVRDRAIQAGKRLQRASSAVLALSQYSMKRCELLQGIMERALPGKCSVKTYADNMNGNREECFKICFDGKAWSALSKSEKVRCGIELINFFSKELGISNALPILIDEGGELTDTTLKRLQSPKRIIVVKAENTGNEFPSVIDIR